MTLPRPHAASPRKQARARWFRKHGAGTGAAAAPASQASVQGSGAFARGSGTANAAAPPLLRALLRAADAPCESFLVFNPEFAIGFSRSNADHKARGGSAGAKRRGAWCFGVPVGSQGRGAAPSGFPRLHPAGEGADQQRRGTATVKAGEANPASLVTSCTLGIALY